MRLYQRGGFYWVDATLADKRRIRKPTGIAVGTGDDKTRAKAEREGERIVSEAGRPGTVTLRQALQYSYDTNWSGKASAKSMEHMIGVLSRHLGHYDINAVTYGILKDYGDALIREKYAPATVNHRMTAIGVALREQVRRGALKARPEIPYWTENNTREVYISHEEEVAILGYFLRQREAALALQDQAAAADWQLMHDIVVFLVDTGFRFSEMFKFTLQGGCADLKHGETKTEKGRRVPLTARASAAAAALLDSPRIKEYASLLVAVPHHKTPWDWVNHRFKRATKDAGLTGVSLHTLRHTCASRLVQRGVPIFTVSKWLGHASVKTTERYAKLAPDSLSHALAALQGGPVAVEESFPGTRSSPHGSDSTDQRHTK